MSLVDKQSQFADMASRLIQKALELGYKVSLGEAYRTPEQAAIYAQKGIGIKDSKHIKRLAIDINLFDSNGGYLTKFEDYEKLGLFWESLGGVWGGRWKLGDFVHFEYKEV